MDLKEYSENIKMQLSLDNIFDLLMSLGADPIKQNGLLTARTICHGGHSHKLYYYENTHLFKCYTDCSDSFDIYQLIIKMQAIEGAEISLPQAINFIATYFNFPPREIILENQEILPDWKIFQQYEKTSSQEDNEKIVELKIYDEDILNYLPRPRILDWEKEGITQEVIKFNNICYDPVMQGIVIPHYDIDGNLIGIRERTLIKENEVNGKYKPAILGYQMYNHPLGFTLYNLNNSKNNVKLYKKVIIFEGEKSSLLYQSYFGIDNDISAAVCGSNLTRYQVDILLQLGVEEIIIAFDKQFQATGDSEWKAWTKKLYDINNKYGAIVKVTFIFDKWNLLSYKMSPIDNGKDIFTKLFQRRIKL